MHSTRTRPQDAIVTLQTCLRSKMSGQGEWQGFSDREIRTLQQSPQQKRIAFKETVRSKPSGSSVKDQQHQAQGKRGSVGAKRQGYGGSFPTNSPPVDGLSERAFFTNPVVPENVEHECDGNTDAKPDDTRVPCSDEDRNTTTSREGPQPQHTESGINFSDNPPTTLEMLQKQQKEIEAENKKRKALLEQTLQERYQRSQIEAKTLEEVKKELVKLDNLVSHDVSLLREKIEEANRQYTAARKKYEQAEAAFVAAKMDLHRTSELKELLSEHFCTVIQQNEVRKASKLADLLQALHIEPPSESRKANPLLFQRTPTPGMDIWPRERLKDSPKLAQKDGAPSSQTGSDADSKQGEPSTASNIGNEVLVVPLVSHGSDENGATTTTSTATGELVKNQTSVETNRDIPNGSEVLSQSRDHPHDQSDTELRHQNSE